MQELNNMYVMRLEVRVIAEEGEKGVCVFTAGEYIG